MKAATDAVDPARLRRVLVTKLRHHGDVLLAAPVLSTLRRHAPGAEIDALVYGDTAAMLDGHPALARLHRIDRAWKQAGAARRLREEWRLWRALRARRYDLIVHLTDQRRGLWLARTLGARWRVAPRPKRADPLWEGSFTHLYALPARGNTRHTVEVNLDALRCLGLDPAPEDSRVVLVPGADAEAAVADRLAPLGGRPFVHIHPASRWMFKTWPAERTAALIDALAADGHAIVITAGPAEVERALVRAILGCATHRPLDLSGQLTLKELAALTARARLFVGVDSAPMHIAAAMGTPTVALFGPSGEHEWGPWRVIHRVVVSDAHPCRPCGQDGCGGSKVSECLTTLPVARVKAAADALLAADRRA
ncbi:MAG: putative lipopolysaccharide heptosyltransferase III [Burkholderiales bacterium]|nr:putative lipopolysaccharide heptosyltransferase III [Burkholderiales bacterium]